MFSSLLQALGVNSTFFIQFFIFLIFYPVLSRMLFRPYCKILAKKEKETSERMKEAENLKKKKEDLQIEYDLKAKKIDKEFNEMYQKESKKIRDSFAQKRLKSQEDMRVQYNEQRQSLFKEIKDAEDKLQLEIKPLTEITVDRLVS